MAPKGGPRVRVTYRYNEIPSVRLAISRAARAANAGLLGEIADAARRNLYPGHGYDTGAMQGSIEVEDERVTVGVPYAAWVHEGHATRGGGYVQGIPFLADAVAAVQGRITHIYRVAFGRLITPAGKRSIR